jgi:hypothetical protein
MRLGCAVREHQHGNQRCELIRGGVALRYLYHRRVLQGHVAVFAVRR